jgi:hypothetical protein
MLARRTAVPVRKVRNASPPALKIGPFMRFVIQHSSVHLWKMIIIIFDSPMRNVNPLLRRGSHSMIGQMPSDSESESGDVLQSVLL